jgi:hypothetical protein
MVAWTKDVREGKKGASVANRRDVRREKKKKRKRAAAGKMGLFIPREEGPRSRSVSAGISLQRVSETTKAFCFDIRFGII